MKKIIPLSCAIFLLSSYGANAQISVTLGEPQPAYIAQPSPVYAPGYVTPAPDYPSEHYDYHRHRHHDYWVEREREEHRREEHRHEERLDEHHDNGHHYGEDHGDHDHGHDH